MTTTATISPARSAEERLHSIPVMLVVGGAFVAPLNLLIVRSFSVYDFLVGAALLYLWRQKRVVWPSRGYLGAAYVFLLFTLVSAFRATYAIEALTQVLQYVFVFFVQMPVVLSVVTTRRRAVTSVVLLCLGTLAAIAHAWVFRPTQGAGRVVVFYSENPNRLGYPAAYLIPLLIALWALSRREARPVRILTSAGVLVGLYLSLWAISASGSRSSLLGSALALLVFLVLRPGLGFVRAMGRLLVVCLVTGVIGFGLVATGQLPTTLEERIGRSLDTHDTNAHTHLVADREHLANAGMHAFVDSPLLGTGLDNFRYVTPRYDPEATPQLPHNLWLQLLVQVGAIGTAAFAFWLLVWADDMVTATRRAGPADAQLLWGLFASMAGILAIFMFAPEMLDRHYWLIAALGLAIVRGSRATPNPASSKGPRP